MLGVAITIYISDLLLQPRVKTVQTGSNKKKYDNRNGSGCTNMKCPSKHTCDFLLPNGKPCDAKHQRTEHSGPTIPPE